MSSPLRILGVAPDGRAAPLQAIRQCLADPGIEWEAVRDLPLAARLLSGAAWDAVVVVLGDRPEDDLAWWVNALHGAPGRPRLIAVVEQPSMGVVLRAERLGVLDLLSLPIRCDALLRVVQQLRAAAHEVAIPFPPADATGPYALVGRSAAMLEVYQLVARVAASNSTVLLQGESGTGKEVVARAIHEHSPRAGGAFVAVNCAAIPENLLESELFGHERGAFTGAVARKIGRFERATGGTLFLDEVGDMSLALQARILRAIQEREIERVGGNDPIPVDVRVVAASNRDLRAAVAQGRFREDLYYRLAVVVIELPRLADRGDDLLLLVAHFTRLFAERLGKSITGISDRALETLREHRWIGNVRELRNVIERAVLAVDGATLRSEHLPEEPRAMAPEALTRMPGGLGTLAEVEARHIARVLAHTGGQIGSAAEILGIHRNTLTRKIREYGL